MPYKEGSTPTRIATTVQDQDSAALNISAATTLETRVKPPGGALETITATFDSVDGTGDGTDGKVASSYTTALRPGTYYWEVYVVLPAGAWYTESGSFTVAAQLG